jgi:hypothetical protein
MPIVSHPELDEIESSRGEKLLAIGLVVFLLIGGFWILDRLGSLPGRPNYEALAAAQGLPQAEAAFRQVEADYRQGFENSEAARLEMDRARAAYEYKREEYRVALARGLEAPALASSHEAARIAFEKASLRFEVADAAREALEGRLVGPTKAYEAAFERVNAAVARAEDRYQFMVFVLRFGYALPVFGLSVWIWLRLRRKQARFLILATSFMGFAGVQAIGLVGQYGWYLLRDVGPIAVSVAGSTVCVAGLVALRRFTGNLLRVTAHRLRRGQCPYCAFPAEVGAAHCPGCGRSLLGACVLCGRSNRRESSFCGGCGCRLEWA